MTTQTAIITAPSGMTLTAKLFTVAAPDTVAFIADSVTERTNAKGEYVASFGEASAISGDHTLIAFSGSTPVSIAKRTFAGVDAEVATETGVELDSATQTKINKIEAAVAGTVTGAGTATEVFVGPSATLTITVDSSGNRSNVSVT